jgi:ribosome-binding factor A
MNKKRKAGIEKEILRTISQVLFDEVKNPKIIGLVSATKCNLTPDMRYTDVYFSAMPMVGQELNTEKLLEGLNEIRGFLRKRLAEELKLRFTPEVRVHLDDTIEHGIKISKLINDLK